MSYRKAPIINYNLFESMTGPTGGGGTGGGNTGDGGGGDWGVSRPPKLSTSSKNESYNQPCRSCGPQQLNEGWWEWVQWNLFGVKRDYHDIKKEIGILDTEIKRDCGAGGDGTNSRCEYLEKRKEELEKYKREIEEDFPDQTGGGGEAEAATMPTIPSGIASRLGKGMPNIGSTVRESFEAQWNREKSLNEQVFGPHGPKPPKGPPKPPVDPKGPQSMSQSKIAKKILAFVKHFAPDILR
jgi:hypothetical protein